jgi:diguanylate cyclase (GGDEF)-like protein
MLRRIFSVTDGAILPLPRTLRAELWGIPPAILLAGVWFGAKGAIVAAVAALPLLLIGTARAPRPEAASLRGDWRDEVSGMPLRMAAVEALDSALAARALTGKATACLVIGLDDPQQIVERYGQDAHDRILRRIAERLAVALRERDCLARLEGDRFAVALAPVRRADLESLIQIAARLQAAVREPVSLDAATVYVSASIGFCLPSRLADPGGAALLSAAEAAMEDARRNGPGAVRAYSPEIAAAATDRAQERDRIEAALEKGEIVAWFQPQLSTDTGEITGFEALARWLHPERGVLPPADFLPAVEDAALAGRLGEVMLFHALTALRSWDRAGYPVPSVAVNFCREELRNPQLAEKLRWELDRFELAPSRLTVEVLESVVSDTDSDAVSHTIAALSRMGCGIDLDDFGTGHASIAAIRRFAVGRIKIDRSFVTRVDSDPSQQRMIAAILSMAERLGLATLAEGVETVTEHAMLAQLGCGHVQGYAIARPMPFADTIGWLERHRSKLSAMPAFGRRTG